MQLDDMKLISCVVSASGGKLIGRTRLQKTFYLLDFLGLQSGFSYEYHHYGPYSADLAESVSDATVLSDLKESLLYRGDGVSYSIFESDFSVPVKINGMDRSELEGALNLLSEESSVVLELAATAHWLANVEKVASWEDEIKIRKGQKTENGRLKRALDLLDRIGLSIN